MSFALYAQILCVTKQIIDGVFDAGLLVTTSDASPVRLPLIFYAPIAELSLRTLVEHNLHNF